MENKLVKFFKIVEWKSVLIITASLLLVFLLPITLLTEKATLVGNNQESYPLRNNLTTLMAIIFRSSDNSDFFKSLASTPNFLALIIIAINIVGYSLLTVPYLIRIKSKRLQLFFLLVFLTMLVVAKLIIYILLITQKESQKNFYNYTYIFQKIKLQPLYFLPLAGYIYYFLSLGWYLSKFIVKRYQK